MSLPIPIFLDPRFYWIFCCWEASHNLLVIHRAAQWWSAALRWCPLGSLWPPVLGGNDGHLGNPEEIWGRKPWKSMGEILEILDFTLLFLYFHGEFDFVVPPKSSCSGENNCFSRITFRRSSIFWRAKILKNRPLGTSSLQQWINENLKKKRATSDEFHPLPPRVHLAGFDIGLPLRKPTSNPGHQGFT